MTRKALMNSLDLACGTKPGFNFLKNQIAKRSCFCKHALVVFNKSIDLLFQFEFQSIDLTKIL